MTPFRPLATPYRHLGSVIPTWTEHEARLIGELAWSLQTASARGVVERPLLGRNLALMGPSPRFSEPGQLHRAAVALGARVARVDFGEPAPTERGLVDLSNLLGRLYDAINCESMQPDLVLAIARHAGVPVYDGLDRDEATSEALVATDGLEHRFVLQAILIATILR